MGQKAKMYLDIMSLSDEVTGSCLLCVLKLPNRETVKFAVDCGLFQESEYNELNESFPFKPESLEFVLVTHNHVDHVGRIPLLYKKGFEGKVFCTNQTKRLMPTALKDTYKILKESAKQQNKKNLFEEGDIDKTVKNIQGFNYNIRYEIKPNIAITFLSNGHLFGSSMILVEATYIEEDTISVLFSGDYKKDNMFFDVEPIPKLIQDTRLTMCIESTYGTTDSSEIRYVFDDYLMQGINEKHTVVVPVFALGRAQEILLKLKELQKKGKLDKSIPIYFDGKLAHHYTSIIYKNKEMAPKNEEFLPENIKLVGPETRQDLLECEHTKIIVTTSGMATYGPAQVYLPYFVAKPNATIIFTGYTAENTLGRILQDTPKNGFVNVRGACVVKKTKVLSTTEFSGHAKSDELIELISEFSQMRSVIVNHGEFEKKEAFAKKVAERIPRVEIIDRRKLVRVGSWGVIKTMNSKF